MLWVRIRFACLCIPCRTAWNFCLLYRFTHNKYIVVWYIRCILILKKISSLLHHILIYSILHYLTLISPIHISSLGSRSSSFADLPASLPSPPFGAMRSLACVTLPKQTAPPETYLINDRSVGLETIPFRIGQTAYFFTGVCCWNSRKGNLIPGMSWQGTEDQWLGLQ